MRISDAEVKKVLSDPSHELVEAIVEIETTRTREEDQALVQSLTEAVISMPDRDEIIADLRARIQAGTYNPSADVIVDGMVRRAIADSMK